VGSIATTLVASTFGGPEDKTAYTNYVKESATDILESLRQSIWVLTEDQISLSQLMVRFNAYVYKNTGQIKDYQYNPQLNISHDPMLESGDILPLYRILQECFQNSIKHSKASIFNLTVTSTKNMLLIHLEDNGQGANLNEDVNGYGLSNIKQRAMEINMEVEIMSQPGQGFSVQLKTNKP
jgi:signal transduction histidine kinase